MTNIIKAIFSKATGSTLSSLVGGRIYRKRAPQGAEFPYVVYFIVVGTSDDAFKQKGRNILFQFSIYSISQEGTEITAIYNALHSLYDDCSLSITGHTAIGMKETNFTTMTDDITGPEGETEAEHWAVEFELLTEG